MKRLQHGFTIVELLVAMTIAIIVLTVALGSYVVLFGQVANTKTRNTLSTDLQFALDRVSVDIRGSSAVSLYNTASDQNAPTTLAGYTSVPGPQTEDSNLYYWRIGRNRLLLQQTPTDTSGAPLYDDAASAGGKKNNIIYYVKDNVLYRRVIPADYPANRLSLLTCSPVVAAGGCPNDTRIVSLLDPAEGQAAFIATLYDGDRQVIAENNYSAYHAAREISVQLDLATTTSGGQTISLSNTARIQLRAAPQTDEAN